MNNIINILLRKPKVKSSFFRLSKWAACKSKLKLKHALSQLNKFLNYYDLEFDQVRLRQKTINQDFNIEYVQKADLENDNNRKKKIYLALKVKDATNTSERNYLKWKSVYPDMESLYSVRQLKNVLNDVLPAIQLRADDKVNGYYIDVRSKIELFLNLYFKKNPNQPGLYYKPVSKCPFPEVMKSPFHYQFSFLLTKGQSEM